MLYLFDDFTLDTQLYELRHAGALCPLEPQVFAILRYLIQHRDRVVTRQELLEHIWPERSLRLPRCSQQRPLALWRGWGWLLVARGKRCL
jgi:DNA-binding winged helix-turn-helix (wHTH) protein